MKTLFVADDNELDLRILRLILLRSPVFARELYFKEWKPLTDYLKSNLDDAVNLPDVIFLDINMPEMGSWHILESLKMMYHRLVKPIAVYIISSTVNAAEIEKALNYSFVKEFIPKPIYRDRIVAIAKEVDNRWA